MFRCLIINPRLANHSHGTGKQLQYFSESSGFECEHVCWDAGNPIGDEIRPYTNLWNDWTWDWPFKTGGGFMARLRARIVRRQLRLGLRWWNGRSLSRGAASRIRKIGARKFDAAYVVVSNEEESAVAGKILAILDLPYVVNWMDFRPAELISADNHPSVLGLCRQAETVFALTSNLAEAIRTISGSSPRLLKIGRKVPDKIATPPVAGKALRCVMIGQTNYLSIRNIWRQVVSLLERKGIEVELFYIGTKETANVLSTQVRTNYLGSLSDAARDSQLGTMHVGLVPGPDGDPRTDVLARYSLPSRIADFLFHGLPTAGSLHPDSATSVELADAAGESCFFSLSAEALADRLVFWAKHPEGWRKASTKALKTAEEIFDQSKILGALTETLQRPTRNPQSRASRRIS